MPRNDNRSAGRDPVFPAGPYASHSIPGVEYRLYPTMDGIWFRKRPGEVWERINHILVPTEVVIAIALNVTHPNGTPTRRVGE